MKMKHYSLFMFLERRDHMSNKTYDILKWVSILLLPTLAWFYGEIAPDWNLPYPEQIVHTLNAIGTMLGIILGVSNLNYNRREGKNE